MYYIVQIEIYWIVLIIEGRDSFDFGFKFDFISGQSFKYFVGLY